MKNTDKGVRTEAIILLKYSRACLWAQRVYIRDKKHLQHDLRVTFSNRPRAARIRYPTVRSARISRRRFNVDLEKARASRHAPSRTAPPASIEQSSRANAMSSAYAALGVSTRAAALGGFSAKVSARRRPSARAPTIFAIRLHARAARSPADRVRPPPHLPAPDSAARAPRPRVPRGHRAGGQGGRRQAQGGEDRPRGGRREGEAP